MDYVVLYVAIMVMNGMDTLSAYYSHMELPNTLLHLTIHKQMAKSNVMFGSLKNRCVGILEAQGYAGPKPWATSAKDCATAWTGPLACLLMKSSLGPRRGCQVLHLWDWSWPKLHLKWRKSTKVLFWIWLSSLVNYVLKPGKLMYDLIVITPVNTIRRSILLKAFCSKVIL